VAKKHHDRRGRASRKAWDLIVISTVAVGKPLEKQ